jgi:hypothetical protein
VAVAAWLYGLLGWPAILTPLLRPDVWRIDEQPLGEPLMTATWSAVGPTGPGWP